MTPPPTTTTATTKPKTTTTATTTEEEKQSRNTKIKNIEIKDAEYKFDNTKNYLEVFIYQKINSLDINLELEDPKSKYTIEGADDLKANGNRVKIEVIAENGQKKTYTLNVKIKDYKTQNDSKEDQEEVIVIFGQKIKKRYATYATWTICIIIALACFIFAIKFTKDRIGNKKYYKALKELEMTKNRRRKI